jgi:hypothetical protein
MLAAPAKIKQGSLSGRFALGLARLIISAGRIFA